MIVSHRFTKNIVVDLNYTEPFCIFFFFTGPNPKQDEVLKVDVKKPHKFIYPRLNFFGSGSSNVVADSSAGWFTFIYNFYVIVYTY